MDILKFIKEKIEKYFIFVIILIIISAISYLGSSITDLTIKTAYVISIILGCSTILIFWTYCHLHSENSQKEIELSRKEREFDDKIKNFEEFTKNIPLDITTQDLNVQIVFDEKSITDHGAITKITRDLKNRMIGHDYELYDIVIYSDSDMPNLEDITVVVEEDSFVPNEIQHKPKLVHSIEKTTDGDKVLLKSLFIHIPVHIRSGKSGKISYSYRSLNFKDSFNGKKDFFEMDIRRITEHLTIDIILSGQMAEQYKLIKCKELASDNSALIYKVFDG